MITVYHSTARSRKLNTIDQTKVGSWVHVVEPSEKDLDVLAAELGLERDILNDATDLYEAPRVETENGVTYVFTRYCHPGGEDTSTEPLLIIYTNNNIITIMRSSNPLFDLMINGQIEVLTTQKTKTFLQILEQINRSYRLRLTAVSRHILRIRREMRQSEISTREFLSFIELEEDLNEFVSALQPQSLVINALESGKYMRLYDDDRDLVEDLNLDTNELIEQSKTKLRTLINLRQAYEAIATSSLNRTFRHLTSIAIFLAIPTTISGLYGMNVIVPLHDNPKAFWIIALIITAIMAITINIFNKRRWL